MQYGSFSIKVMKPCDYDAAVKLWNRLPAIYVGQNETPELIERFLRRNPGLSFIATLDSRIVGTVLCGYDGLTGFLHHVAVDPDVSGRGIGKILVKQCLNKLARLGIEKCQIIVARENLPAQRFWRNAGWLPLPDRQLLGQSAEQFSCIAAYHQGEAKRRRRAA
jgi:putative acetyltransferase